MELVVATMQHVVSRFVVDCEAQLRGLLFETVDEADTDTGSDQKQPQLTGQFRPIGSAALGIDGPADDLDACLVLLAPTARPERAAEAGPKIITAFAEFLARADEAVTGVFTVLTAKVPLLRATVLGKQVDVQVVVDWTDATCDEQPRRFPVGDPSSAGRLAIALPGALLGCVGKDRVDVFRSALVCLRGWAKSRRLYGSIDGFPPGVAWAILCAKQVQIMRQDASATDVCLGVIRTITTWPWASQPYRLLPVDDDAGDAVWAPPSLPALQQPMAVLTPFFEQNTCVAVTETHLSVLLLECEEALRLDLAGQRPSAGPPLRWFSGLFVLTMPQRGGGDAAGAAWLQALRSKMPLVAQQLGGYGLAIRPLGWVEARAAWVFGWQTRGMPEACSRSQLKCLAGFVHGFLVARFTQAEREAGKDFPVWDIFWPAAAWPVWCREMCGLPRSAADLKLQHRLKQERKTIQPHATGAGSEMAGVNTIASRSIAMLAQPPPLGSEIGRIPYSTGCA